MRLIDADDFGNRMYHEAFEKDSDLQKWDSGCWIRYKLFENVLRGQPTAQPELIAQDAYARGFEQGRTQGMIDANLQPEEAIPVSWIESRIERLMMAGDAFSGLTASIIRVILNEWEKEQEGGTDGSD